ncbi:MAG: response regulator transcription factor [Chloroflexota bacterium]|nr:response regulator transcription factor [Chloroflexota bacterium]MDQ5867098.1 response regulator transcription factor [Chloroflexota bacterium]
MQQPITVLLADDTDVTRRGWRSMLEGEPDIQVIGEAHTVAEVPVKVRDLKPDILLLDLAWGQERTAGLTALKMAKEANERTKVIVITVHQDLESEARKLGADITFSKGCSTEDLRASIRALYELPRFVYTPDPNPPPAAQVQKLEPSSKVPNDPRQLAALFLIPTMSLLLILGGLVAAARFLPFEVFLFVAAVTGLLLFFLVIYVMRSMQDLNEANTTDLMKRLITILSRLFGFIFTRPEDRSKDK